MKKEEFDAVVRANLIQERKRLMDLLESQGDFPDKETVARYEANKRKIINFDAHLAQEKH